MELHREGSAPAACAAGLFEREKCKQSKSLNTLYKKYIGSFLNDQLAHTFEFSIVESFKMHLVVAVNGGEHI